LSSIKNINPYFIPGDSFTDQRGTLRFANDFQFENVKRFYLIENQPVGFVRAWQGHQHESKFFYVISGKFRICAVRIDNWQKPSLNLPVQVFNMSEKVSQILVIPGGYANGMQSMTTNARLLVFSDMLLVQSKDDDIRFSENLWFDWTSTPL